MTRYGKPADPFGAFVPFDSPVVAGAVAGPLAGMTFAVKDIYDVAGSVTGCGNPTRRRTHAPARHNAPSVQALLDAGACMVGKTITDELAFSIIGANAHYGTPVNPACAERVPGGSSSGSVSAVAGHLVDFALGSDTGGSVRVPASHCGVLGIRTTHGRIALDRVMPLAPSFDTVGWFARDGGILLRAGEALFGETAPSVPAVRLLAARDAFAVAAPGAQSSLAAARRRVEDRSGAAREIVVAAEGLAAWFELFRTLQFYEAWQSHGAWITTANPDLAPPIKERFLAASRVSADEYRAGLLRRAEIRNRLDALLGEDGVLCLPAAPSAAPRRDASAAANDDYRARALQLTCVAGLAGLPQLSLPLAADEGCPLGLSLIAGRGRDLLLLAIAEALLG